MKKSYYQKISKDSSKKNSYNKSIEKFVDECIRRQGRLLIPILQEIQANFRYLPEPALREVSKKLGLPLRDIYGVATFYKAFSLTPKGKHVITVCLGTACHVRGGAHIVNTLSSDLNISSGETTSDKKFTLETVNCLGCCAIGPVVVVDGEYHGEMNPQKTRKVIEELEKEEAHGKA
ncbi:MAG: NADH-quinone oxidoreductase subunit NuoE family protein [Candidatus Aminicenantia bacterium]